jgi:hypothetical protein
MIKKIYILFAIQFICSAVEAQSIFASPYKVKPGIDKDEIGAENVRYIKTTERTANVSVDNLLHGKSRPTDVYLYCFCPKDVSSDKIPVYMAFRLYQTDKEILVNANSPILLKSNNDSVYTLKVSTEAKDEVGHVRVGEFSSYTKYMAVACVLINDSIVSTIKNNGIKKMRLSVTGNNYDIELKKDNLSQFIFDSYQLVKAKLKEKRDFKDNF